MKNQNLIHKKFNRLRVIQPWGKDHNIITYLCECSCGGRAIVRADRLKSGKTKSCGCLQIQFAKSIIGRARERQDQVWRMIEERQRVGE
jgi:hypothetical protein